MLSELKMSTFHDNAVESNFNNNNNNNNNNDNHLFLF